MAEGLAELTEGKLTGHDGGAQPGITTRAGQVQVIPQRSEERAYATDMGRVVSDDICGAVGGLLCVAPGDIAIATAVGKASAASNCQLVLAVR